MTEKILKNLIFKHNQGTDLESFWDWIYKFDICKDCVDAFKKKFRLAIMILALPLNEKPSL